MQHISQEQASNLLKLSREFLQLADEHFEAHPTVAEYKTPGGNSGVELLNKTRQPLRDVIEQLEQFRA